MKREEAIALGIEVLPINHTMKRRTPWHDYSQRGIYMLTLVVEGRLPLFGELKGTVDATSPSAAAQCSPAPQQGATEACSSTSAQRSPADPPRVEPSALGRAILSEEIAKINRYYPQVEVWKTCIMPDHLHLIVSVNEDLPPGKHLGQVVRGFKTGCSRAWWRLYPLPSGKAEGTEPPVPSASPSASVPSASPEGSRPVLFEPGYNDKLLLHKGQLATWKAYLDDNPRRLLIKRQNPHLFNVITGLQVAGRSCQVVGNRFLLDIPDKMAVIVHRRYTNADCARLREEWLACGERGGVLVSAAIAPKEKAVMREAMERGYRIILLRENGFPKIYKPSGESFDACSEGLLLQVSPWPFHMERKTITRAECLELNAMAEQIVGEA